MSNEAMKLALEALQFMDSNYISLPQQGMQAIKALEEALAKQGMTKQGITKQQEHCEPEPVGQLLEDAFGRGQVMWFNKPKDESMLYTTPQQRTWVGLTVDELITLEQKHMRHEDLVNAIEAKLKEKNT
jgi:hypothetical protein